MIKKNNKQLKSTVLRDSREKTVLVTVDIFKKHPIYQKRYRLQKKFIVHTETEVKKGTLCLIEESRPISRRKSWRVVKVIKSPRGEQ